MNYVKFLFEAAIDAWFKKNKELSQDEKLKAEIIFKDLQSKYTEHLHQNAKNLVVLNFQTLNLLYSAILEAIKQNLLPTTVQWLTKQVVDGKAISLENIMEDYIPPLRVYQNNKEKLPDLNTIPDITSLNNILNENLEPEQKQLVNESDLGKIAEMDGWSLYMPHTTAASCELGTTGGKRDTTWCTTRTDGKNLYLQYVGRFKENYTLFYVIKRGVNASKKPFAKMSIGTAGNQILFDQGDNSVSVNADNKNLTEEKFRQVVGDKIADFFLEKIREIIGDPEFKHPMKAEMERLATDPKLFLKKLNTYGDNENDQELKRDLIREILKYDNVHPEILMLLAEDDNYRIRLRVAQNPKTPPEILRLLAKDYDEDIRVDVAKNPNTPPETLILLAKDENSNVRSAVANNQKTPPEALLLLAEDKVPYIRVDVAKNPNTPPETLILLAKDKQESVRRAVAYNKKTPPEALRLLAKDEDYYVRRAVAKKPNISPEILLLLAENEDRDVRQTVAENPNTPPEALRLLAQDKFAIREKVAKNPNTPPETLMLLAKDEYDEVRLDVAMNQNTPPEILMLLAKDKDYYVRRAVAKNPNTPPESLMILAENEYDDVRLAVAKNPNTPPEIAQKLETELRLLGLYESRKPIKISLLSIIFKN